jgi:hypothetical protein
MGGILGYLHNKKIMMHTHSILHKSKRPRQECRGLRKIYEALVQIFPSILMRAVMPVMTATVAARAPTAENTPMTSRRPPFIRPMAWDRAFDRYLATLRLYIVAAGLPVLPSFGDIL